MPLIRFPTVKGLVYTIDLSKIADRENPRTVESAVVSNTGEPTIIDWGDGTVEIIPVNTYTYRTHEYAEVGVYTVTVRRSSGTLPPINFSGDSGTTAAKNLTLAVVSIDHFGGIMNNTSAYAICRNTANLRYVDPRYIGGYWWTSMSNVLQGSGLEQSLDSFCFDFSVAVNFYVCFSGSTKITGSPVKLPDGVTNMYGMYLQCANIDGEIPPFPSTIQNIGYAFYGCSKLKGVFPELPVTVTGSMLYAFWSCSSLTGKLPDIPDGVTSLQAAFYSCHGATEFPDELPSSLTDVRSAFAVSRGLNVSANAAPELWNTANYPSISQYSGCFTNLLSLSNYADIPAGWK